MADNARIVEQQIGRTPRGFLKVESYCQYGYPKVIQVYPLLREGEKFEPFPTLFWLTCPIIVEQISRIEEERAVDALEKELSENPALQAEYERDHRCYASERFALLKPEDKAFLAERGLIETLRDRGIAGIQDLHYVKCLHTHYAHHLARGSLIGRLLEEHHAIVECNPKQVRCHSLSSK
jgi:hypothetical protein